MMSILFCDTNSELWYTDAEALGITHVIRMPYILDGEEVYYDLGKNTDFEHFYERMRAGSMPTTAALNTFNYIEYFEPVLAGGEDILYITFSHKMSATFTYMEEAIKQLKEKYPDRTVRYFDTKGISMSCGIQVYYAAKLKKEGASDDEILAFLAEFTNKIGTYFVPDDLNHLKRGGRISATKAAFGTLLGIKPLIRMEEDGTLKNIGTIKGSKRVISELVSLVKGGVNFDQYDVWIMHADCEDRARELAERIKREVGEEVRLHVQMVGPVIATHCGPGTLAVIFPAEHR